MSRAKVRKKRLKEKREEREKNNWKKNQYHSMARKGLLGNRELQTYRMMYGSLNGDREYFTNPENNPSRNDYYRLKKKYTSIENKF